jgi:hypothetical protein
LGGVITAAYLCTAVFDGDLQLLRRLITAGANVNAIDYDKRTATHIAAADGSLSMVSMNFFRLCARVCCVSKSHHYVFLNDWFILWDVGVPCNGL